MGIGHFSQVFVFHIHSPVSSTWGKMQGKEGIWEIISSRSLFHEMWLQMMLWGPFQPGPSPDSSRHSSIPFHVTATLIKDHEAPWQHSQISMIWILAGMFCFHLNPNFLVLKSSYFLGLGFIFGFCGKCLAESWSNLTYPKDPGNFREFPTILTSRVGLWNNFLAQKSWGGIATPCPKIHL